MVPGQSEPEITLQITQSSQEGRRGFGLKGLRHLADDHLFILWPVHPKGFSIRNNLVLAWLAVDPAHFPGFFKIDNPIGILLFSQTFNDRLLNKVRLKVSVDFILFLDFGQYLIKGKRLPFSGCWAKPNQKEYQKSSPNFGRHSLPQTTVGHQAKT